MSSMNIKYQEITSIDKMVVIGGVARSGTTLMGKLVNSLSKTEYYYEPPMLANLLLKKNELSKESLKELIKFYFYDNFLLDSLAGRNINLNKNDDSCILSAKNEQDVKKRQKRSHTRIELEKLARDVNFSFKLPEIVFFLKTLDAIFPKNVKILLYREHNAVISSILRKKWFSDLNIKDTSPSQIYASEIIQGVKIPYWIKKQDLKFWIRSDEINRCAYYYKRCLEEVVKNSKSSIIIDYDQLIKKPNEIFSKLVNKIGFKYGQKTKEILSTIKSKKKKIHDFKLKIDSKLISDISKFNIKLKKFSDN